MSRQHQPEIRYESSGTSFFALVGVLGVGAALMYFFDPDSGRRRREALAEKYDQGKTALQQKTVAAVHNAADQTRGAIARIQNRIGKPDQAIDVTAAVPSSTSIDRGNPS
ncbi:MAG TPA: YtxH domain-containing protein [Usitatibacter sp.]|nr:YtxH domain-containing protein [Usitatibacter sp.]